MKTGASSSLLLLLSYISRSQGFLVYPVCRRSGTCNINKQLQSTGIRSSSSVVRILSNLDFSSNDDQGSSSTLDRDEAAANSNIDTDLDDTLLDGAYKQAMHTVSMDWSKEGPATKTLRREAASSSSSPSPFAEYEALVEPPASHDVYYRGHHDRSFWRQGKEVIQLCVPVPPETSKSDVRFKMKTKEHVYLSIGQDDVIFDRELAEPVFTETAWWYFEKPDDEHKILVVELFKRMDYSNWPGLFPEDPDLSQQQQQSQ